jgi:hypothetical protein
MGDIAQRGNKLTKGVKDLVTAPYKGAKKVVQGAKDLITAPIQDKALVRDVYEHVAHKHSLGTKKKPHSSKEGRTASLGRTVRDVGKIFGSERVKKFGGGRTNLLEELGRVEGEPSNPNRRAEISRVHSELNKGYKKGGRVGRPKKPSTHGKDVPTMAAKGGRIGFREGTPKAVEKAATQKKIEQTQDVKRLTTSDDAYSPEKRIIHASKPYYNGSTLTGSVNTRRNVTDWHNIKKEKEKLKDKFGRGTRVNVYTEQTDPRRRFKRRNEKRAVKGVDIRKRQQQMIKEKYAKKAERRAEGGRIGFKKGGNGKWMQKVSASIKKRGTKGKCTPITKPGCTGRAKALAKTFKKIAAKRKA